MYAIKTKYVPATNKSGSKIKAFDGYHRAVTIPYHSDKHSIDLHIEAARLFKEKHYQEHTGTMTGGETLGGQYVFVFDSCGLKI